MKIIIKTITCFFLSISILLNSFITCYANGIGEGITNIGRFIVYGLAELGCVVRGDLQGAMMTSDAFNEWKITAKPWGDDYDYSKLDDEFFFPRQNDDGTLTISDEQMDLIYQYIRDTAIDYNGYFLLKDCGRSLGDFQNEFNDISTPTKNFISSYSDVTNSKIFVKSSSGCSFMYVDYNNTIKYAYLWNSNPNYLFFTAEDGEIIVQLPGMRSTESFYTTYFIDSISPSESESNKGKTTDVNYLKEHYKGPAIKIFTTRGNLTNYIMQSKPTSVYMTNNFYNYDMSKDNSVTINGDVYNNTDWGKLNETAYKNIQGKIDDMSSTLDRLPTDDEIQSIVDDVGKSVTDAIESGTGQITEVINSSNAEQVTWLKNIYNKLKEIGDYISNGFKNIGDIIKNNSGGTVSVDLKPLQDAIAELKKTIISNNTTLNDSITSLINKCDEILTKIPENTGDYTPTDLTTVENLLREILDSLQGGTGGSGDVTIDTTALENLLKSIDQHLSGIEDAVTNIDSKPLYDLLDSISKSLDSSKGFLSDIKDNLLEIKNNQQTEKEILNQILESIKNIETEEQADSFINTLVVAFTPVAEKAKTKFPISLPWDIAGVVGMLASTPETPVFEVPIKVESAGIDETLTIDLTRFEPLSKLSRAFLSITFLIILISLTVKFVKGDDDS